MSEPAMRRMVLIGATGLVGMALIREARDFPYVRLTALARREARPHKRLYDRRAELMDRLRQAYRQARKFRDERVEAWELPTVDATDS